MIQPTVLLAAALAVVFAPELGIARSQPHSASDGGPQSSDLRPSAEMQRLLDAFGGDWNVRETFEVSGSRQGKSRQGTASFRLGPGSSLIENYRSDGSAGKLDFLALLWWDRSANVYRMLTCANNDGCDLRGTAKWEGNAFVNSWEEEVDGKKAAFKDSFVDFSPSGFRLVSEGSADGKTISRVITKYVRKGR